ncbi:MAG: 2,3,4,5-tetrahydropyridine-2,6-dicarboxylate N-succinyltransferase [Acidimicrobiia bacterium]|nr:2,3,4,5-tetrahydropyridine-2,6-dicarboxylate N-succinyltransferase [Acidimicrobiia bacterium]
MDGAVGIGIATYSTVTDAQPLLDVRFAGYRLGGWDDAAAAGPFASGGTHPLSGGDLATGARLAGGADLAAVATDDPVRRTRSVPVSVVVEDLAKPPGDAADVYLRLHLLSACLVRPHGQNLDGVFGLLHNVVWSTQGPCDTDDFDTTRWRLAAAGRTPQIFGVDKFPRMVDYVVPKGVRLADADRARLGAHLSPGTTVMHEGFCNFNAGTLGTSMVEGRISAGVVVGDGSDIGGSASIMGTLSGGGTEVISVGERCLLGANSGIGISLGDDCIVEAGLYVTGGTPVTLPDGTVVKGRDVSGRSNLLYRRNGRTGTVEAVTRDGSRWGGLNEALHSND